MVTTKQVKHHNCGAVICFSDNTGGAGHVGIVEEIASDGTITVSNSAWQGTFFFLTYITPVNGRYDWSHYTCQGFIYNPYAFQPTPPTPPADDKKNVFPWVLYARKFRNKRLTINNNPYYNYFGW